MDFTLSPKLTQLREDARAFAERAVEPSVASRDQRRHWEPELFTELAAQGILGAFLPREQGGRELSTLETCFLLEGFGEGSGDAGLALAVGVHGLLCAVPIWKLGTSAQKQKYLSKIISGEWVGGLSLFELEGGAAMPNLTARAVRQGRRWLLNGVKAHVLNAPVAHHFLVTAVTNFSASPARLSAFLVDRESPGLYLRTPSEPMGMRTCPTADLLLEDCELPEEALLGTEGAALSEVLPLLLALDRTCLLAPWLGLMRALTARTLQRAREQELFARPLARFQSVRIMLSDMKTRCELSGDMLYRAAWQLDHLSRPPRLDAAGARLFVSTSAQKVARDAIQVHGLYGLAPHHLVERTCRDSMHLTITGGGNEVLRSIIAGSLLNLG